MPFQPDLPITLNIDQVRTGGTLLNQKFTPALLADETGLQALVKLIRSYFKLDGHHIQFNVVDGETLRQAKLHPAIPYNLNIEKACIPSVADIVDGVLRMV